MNYLAHAYLSFDDPEVLTGNIISDFVKGKKKYDYARRILKGIELHRYIDSFTDAHPLNKEAAKVFKPAYGLYASAFLDVAYDHFLATQLAAAGQHQFEHYTLNIYNQIQAFEPLLPPTFREIFPYMKEHNWLYNYQFAWGIEKSFEGVVHRAKYLNEGTTAYLIFKQHYNELAAAFDMFFPQLKSYALEKYSDIQ